MDLLIIDLRPTVPDPVSEKKRISIFESQKDQTRIRLHNTYHMNGKVFFGRNRFYMT